MSGFSRTFTYFFNPLNSTMSLVIVVRATARRFPSRDHAKDATWRSLKCVICRGRPPSSGCDQRALIDISQQERAKAKRAHQSREWSQQSR